jgi:hypothetical protein
VHARPQARSTLPPGPRRHHWRVDLVRAATNEAGISAGSDLGLGSAVGGGMARRWRGRWEQVGELAVSMEHTGGESGGGGSRILELGRMPCLLARERRGRSDGQDGEID